MLIKTIRKNLIRIFPPNSDSLIDKNNFNMSTFIIYLSDLLNKYLKCSFSLLYKMEELFVTRMKNIGK